MMDIDKMWVIFNRFLIGGTITGDEALMLLRWMLLPEDEKEIE